jgi:hypothetical protein
MEYRTGLAAGPEQLIRQTEQLARPAPSRSLPGRRWRIVLLAGLAGILGLAAAASGTLNIDLLVAGQWQSAGLSTINGKKLSAGWNPITGFAAVPADALRITFQGGQGSAGEIREIAATGSGTGTAFVPAIDVA